ncbi:MAG: hypothetical protein KC729_04495, partial [Candidatus Eisenbacteria bacterium]|nr:hypothetical protein [Candidatus Eisenbacteria bacterium]
TADECAANGGVYQGDDTTCDPNPCPQPPTSGACCADDGSCAVTTADECAANGGVYQGDDTTCDPNPCPQPPTSGACCADDGSCAVTTADECAANGGVYQGDDTTCDPNPCPPAEGDEGCGLGYWKNHHGSWGPTGLTPGDPVGASFVIPEELAEMADDSLDDALRYPGGNGVDGAARLLLRDAVVALLNAAHPDVHFSLTSDEVASIVNDGLASLDRRTMQDARHDIGPSNGGGCPLN